MLLSFCSRFKFSAVANLCVALSLGPASILEEISPGKTQLNFYEKDDTFKFTIHVSVAQRPSSVESRIKLKLHLNL